MDDWEKAGKLAAGLLNFGSKLIKVDASSFGVIKKIEEKALKDKIEFAFPISLAINELAAHASPSPDENLIFKEGDVIKLDLGVHVKGAIGDNATTIDLGDNKKLLKSSQEALKEAIKIIQPGIEVREIGRVIQDTITSYDLSPIKNLSGHTIEEYTVHAGLSIPNYDNGNKTKIEEGMIFAIEPFSTKGEGLVIEGKKSTIYKLSNKKPTRNPNARKILNFIEKEYNTLPFAGRWINERFSNANFSLRILENEGSLHHYTELIERSRGLVSQHEHTIRVENKAKILTEI